MKAGVEQEPMIFLDISAFNSNFSTTQNSSHSIEMGKILSESNTGNSQRSQTIDGLGAARMIFSDKSKVSNDQDRKVKEN